MIRPTTNQILTPEQLKKEAIWNEINAILQRYRVNLSPSVSITPQGMGFQIDLIDAQPQGSGGPQNVQ